MGMSKLTDKRTKIRPKGQDWSCQLIIFVSFFSSLATMLLLLFGVASFMNCLYDIIHFLWSRSPLHTVVLCTLIWSIPEKIAQSLSKSSLKQCTSNSIMPRQHAWWYRSTIWRKKTKADISELCSFPILKIISWRT